MTRTIISIMIIILLVLVIIICAAIFFPAFNQSKENEELYADLRQNAPNVELEKGWMPVEYDVAPLREINDSAVGWITIPGTVIDYPVAQADDNEYYLDVAFTGEESIYGSIFLDYRNTAALDARNNIFFGHRMNDESMFGSLYHYQEQDYYEAHPVIHLFMAEGCFVGEIFAAQVIDKDGDYLRTQFDDEDDFRAFVDDKYAHSVIDTGVVVEPGDNIVTLTTCVKSDDENRFALYARLIPMLGEHLEE